MGLQQSFISYGGATERLMYDLTMYAQRDKTVDEAYVI